MTWMMMALTLNLMTRIQMMLMTQKNETRIDKWLWAVRIYKNRSLAKDACDSGKIKINDQPAKAAKSVNEGDVVEVRKSGVRYRYKVLQPIQKRVNAELAKQAAEDITPQAELDKLKGRLPSVFHAPSFEGKGRPTKKNRRDLDNLLGNSD
jgi:ribosome-associated heat shock protein Hsp15